jgi:hypothetical protein
MMQMAAIVEGDGEVRSLPILVRRLNEWQPAADYIHPLPPIKIRRDRFLEREDDFRKYVLLAAAKCGADGWLMILLDADDDCPAQLAAATMRRVATITSHSRVSIVLANREYEAWFIAAAPSLDGHRSFKLNPEDMAVDAERPRDAKGWVKARMQGKSYGETTDQPAFTALFDLQQAHDKSRSFRKLCSEWQKHAGTPQAVS